MKKVFTTGQVAKICKVAPRTVSKWFDSGRLRGYRIPGSQDRRIPRDHLIKFLREHNMPLGDLMEEETQKVLVADTNPDLAASVRNCLAEDRDTEVETASTLLELGAKADRMKPNVMLIDVNLTSRPTDDLCGQIRRLPGLEKAVLVATSGEGSLSLEAARARGFDDYVSKPFDLDRLSDRIRSLMERDRY